MTSKGLVAFAALMLAGCTELAYYGQAVSGHWRIMQSRRPLSELLAEPDLQPVLRRDFATARALRAFASGELALPDNGSYTSYVALDRPYAVYNVFAAPELSLEPYRWCYPLIGCAAYRGYFARADAEREADRLRSQGYDVFVAGVVAYSTLGWFDDPLLSTFIDWPEGLLAELMFHELAHQRVFLAGDTEFNESFASTVGRLGAERWLRGRPEALAEYRRYRGYRQDFRALLDGARKSLAAVYADDQTPAAKRAARQQRLAALLEQYRRLKRERWNGFAGYDRWVGGGFNNAKLASLRAYDAYVPAFRVLFRRAGGDFAAFYRAVEQLADQPPDERRRRLEGLAASAR